MPLHYRYGFHSHLTDLNKPLRYPLGGYRPSKTTRQILSAYDFLIHVSVYPSEEWYFIFRVHHSRDRDFNLSHLCYASNEYTQYQAVVKLLGSFRLSAGNRHLHRYCIFTELILETVPQSLHHSCTSELTRQGISLP